jgi:enoyl-CoA hydratase/carnithine racemase
MFGPATPLSSSAKRHIIMSGINNVRLGRQHIRRPALRIEGDPMSDSIVVTDDGAVRVIRMNRPEKKNALTQPMYAAMTGAMREAEANAAIRCLVLAGGQGAFCAGADIGEFLESAQSGGLRPHTLEFLKVLANNQKPLVAAVGGLAVGIGTTLLFHCDHVVAAADATFTTPFLKLALIPEAASSLLAPMRMGYARAFEMLVMGHPLSAEQAREAGIVNKVVEAAAVDAVALQAAREIAALPAGAVAVSRRLLRGHLDAVVRQIDTEVMHFKDRLQSDEARAAFSAFLSRKK